MITVVDYTFNRIIVTNPDGSSQTDFTPATLLSGGGPGTILGLTYYDAIDLGTTAVGRVAIGGFGTLENWARFQLRIVFSFDTAFNGIQRLVQCNSGPSFELNLVGSGGTIHLAAQVTRSDDKPVQTETVGIPPVLPGTWYVADLVYDTDTLFVFQNGEVISVHGLGDQGLLKMDDPPPPLNLGIGGAVSVTTAEKFIGKLAAFKLEVAGVSPALQTLADNARLTAQWYITTKVENLPVASDMGAAVSQASFDEFDTFAWTQQYTNGILMYHSSANSAYALRGSFLTYFQNISPSDQKVLGYLVSDEIQDADNTSRIDFSNGAIYRRTGGLPFHIAGQMYLDYQSSGGRKKWGVPTGRAEGIPGGLFQQMEKATFFLLLEDGVTEHDGNGNCAHTIQNEIRAKHAADTVGMGFPVVDEQTVLGIDEQKMVEFGTIGGPGFPTATTCYSSPRTGTHTVVGRIRTTYHDIGGPTAIGLPKMDQEPAVGKPNAIVQLFQKAVIWAGPPGVPFVIRPFTITLQEVNTAPEDVENDIYVVLGVYYINGLTGERTKMQLMDRLPADGDWGSRNQVLGINTVISKDLEVKDVRDSIVLVITANDRDTFPGDLDDLLGTWNKTLDASNAWGYAELDTNNILSSGPQGGFVFDIKVEFKPGAIPTLASEPEKFWGVPDAPASPLPMTLYRASFSDILPEADQGRPLDAVRDAFHSYVVSDMAISGNCFGMCDEAIFARKFVNKYEWPLITQSSTSGVRLAWNTRQQHQAGSAPWWWWADQVITPGVLDPTRVFDETEKRWNRGDQPVLTLYETARSDNTAHCVLPVFWSKSPSTWTILVLDPDMVPPLQSLNIEPVAREFAYTGVRAAGTGATHTWATTNGAKLHFIPWTLVNRMPRTGLWEPVLSNVEGTMIAVAKDAVTVSITDLSGFDMDVTGHRAVTGLEAGRRIDGLFARLPIYMAGGFPGEIFLSKRVAPRGTADMAGGSPTDDPVWTDMKLATIRPYLHPLPALESLQQRWPGDFVHTVRGSREAGGGQLDYFVKSSLCHLHVECGLALDEEFKIEARAIRTIAAQYLITATREKEVRLTMVHRLGLADDFVSVMLRMHWTPGPGPGPESSTLQLIVRPGLASLDLIPGHNKMLEGAVVTVTSSVGLRKLHKEFTLPHGYHDGTIFGIRLKINPAFVNRKIMAATLDIGRDVVESLSF
jgi:hypothetical protein